MVVVVVVVIVVVVVVVIVVVVVPVVEVVVVVGLAVVVVLASSSEAIGDSKSITYCLNASRPSITPKDPTREKAMTPKFACKKCALY